MGQGLKHGWTRHFHHKEQVTDELMDR